MSVVRSLRTTDCKLSPSKATIYAFALPEKRPRSAVGMGKAELELFHRNRVRAGEEVGRFPNSVKISANVWLKGIVRRVEARNG